MEKVSNIVILIFLLVLPGCDLNLDLEPITEETSINAYETPEQIEAALIGIYDAFGEGTENFYNEYYVWDLLNLQDTRADNAYSGGDTPELFAIDFLNIVPTNDRLRWHWGALYSAIAKANVVLERAPLVQDSEYRATRMNELMGEAFFLRAYHYYHLVTLFSGVPLITEPTTSILPEDTNLARSTSEEIYSQIIEDLDQAIKSLPDKFASNDATRARATAGAANSLAAKANLQKPNPNYQAALDHIVAVEASSANYKLLQNYDDLFNGENENNEESILEMQFVSENSEGSLRPQLVLPPSLTNDTWRKFITPSHDIINLFQARGDNLRLNASVLFEPAPWIDEYWGNQINSVIPFVYKWRTPGWESDNNAYLIRYGDIVLLKAEALNELNRIEEAVQEVNRIRGRVALPDVTGVESSSKEIMRQTIMDERRLELAFEGERWNDLVRMKQAVSVMNNLLEIDLRSGTSVNYNMTLEKLYLPIPQSEMDLNPELIQGYL